jgi:tetratricopeptide (TPR) repeat protein
VRYIGVAFGVGRYQPHQADEVLENQYGDCKDKHTLLAAMLGALGVKTDAVLIGAGIRFNPEVPSPAAFNHLITLATVDGKPVWLDTTAEVAPYQMLVYAIRDHQALAVPETGAARLERTPKELPFKPFQKMEAVGSLDKDGVSESKIILTLRGDEELELRAVLRQIAPAQYEQLMQNISRGMGYAGTTSHAEFSKAEETDDPITVHYGYHREKAGDWDHLRTLSQLAPIALPVPDEKDPPVRAIELGVPRVETSTAAMKLPDGWSVELPEALHAHSAYVNLDQTYRFEKGTLYAERKVEVLVEKVPQTEWKSYKKWTDAADLGNEEYVQLTRPGANKDMFTVVGGQGAREIVDGSGTAEGGGEGAKAAALVKSAYEAVQRREFATAIKNLDEAKALNEHQAGLWSTYGFASLRRGAMTEALKDYEKELELHPDAVAVYQDIVTVDVALGKHEDTIAALRLWAAAEPSNPQPTLVLVRMQMLDEDFAGAVKSADAGIAGLPEDQREDENLQMLLGTAQLKAGMKEKGAATLVTLLKSENPFILNGAAYALADENEQLDLAEKSTRAALAKLGEESREWTLDESLEVLRGKSETFLATWDTMGWVLFREGKTDEAESYIRATWVNLQNTEVGEHLGDVLLKKGEKANAVKAYELALGTISPYDAMGKKPDKQSAIEVRLKKKITAAGSSSKDLNGNYTAALQDMRKISLGSANGLNGAAEYKLLLGEHGIVRAEPAGDKKIDGGEERLKKLLLTGYWPAGLDGRLVRSAILNCHSGECELVFEP